MNVHAEEASGTASIGRRPASVSRRERLVLAIAVAVAVPSLLLLGGLVSLPSLVEDGIEWLLPGHAQSTARGIQADSVRYSPMSIRKAGPAAVSVPAVLSGVAGHASYGVAGATEGAQRPRATHRGSVSLGSKVPTATGATAAGDPAPSGSDDATSSPASGGAGKAPSAPPTVTAGAQGAAASARVAVHGTHAAASVSVSAANSTMTADVAPASGSTGAGAAVATPVGEVGASAAVTAPAAVSATAATPVASAQVATPSAEATAPVASAAAATPLTSPAVDTTAVPAPAVSLPLATTP